MTSSCSARFTDVAERNVVRARHRLSMPSVKTSTTRRPSTCSSAVIPTLTAFHSGVGPSSCSSVCRICCSSSLVARELARIDLDAVGEAADARLVGGQQALDERLGGLAHQIEVLAHADAAIEHHHDVDRLDVVGERRDLLQLAVVVDLELVAIEIRHEPAAGVGDGRIDRDRVGAGAERRLLWDGAATRRRAAPRRPW